MSFQDAYEEMAAQLNTTPESLTDDEKREARNNEVLRWLLQPDSEPDADDMLQILLDAHNARVKRMAAA